MVPVCFTAFAALFSNVTACSCLVCFKSCLLTALILRELYGFTVWFSSDRGFLSGSLYFQCSWKTDHAHIQSVLHCLACTSNQTFSLPCTLLQAQACTHSACQADARVAKRAADVTLARARVQLPYRLPHLSICVLSATARPGDPRCVCSRPLSQLWWQTMGPPVPAPVKGARVERGSFLLGPKTPTGR